MAIIISAVSFAATGIEIRSGVRQGRFHWEVKRNENGWYAKKARQQLDSYNYKPTTLAYKAYIQGKLPDFHIRNQAKRWAVKVFLAHYYTIDYYTRYGKLPLDTYGLDILKGTKKIHVPDWDKDKVDE